MSSGIDAAESIGERLRRLRVERSLSQRELSAPGVSYAYISRIEAGARRPSVKALRVLARKLGVSAEYLETGSEVHDFERRELRLTETELRLRLGDDAGAEAELAQLLRESLASGDIAAATRARVDLGFAASARGDHARAAGLLEDALESGIVSPAARADVFFALGREWSALGHPERAIALFERCRAELREQPSADEGLDLRFAAQLSAALADAGEFERAHEVLHDAVQETRGPHDPYARVRVYRSLGRASGDDGRLQLSLAYYRRALALLEAADDGRELARAHLAAAWVLISTGQLDAAESELALAEQLFGPAPAQADGVALRRHEAELARQRGDTRTAVARAREAIALAGDSLPDERGNAWFVIAAAQAADGGTADADHAFGEAAALLDEHGTPRERSECYRAWARLLRAAGREAEALDVLERAAEFAAEVRAHGPAFDR